MEPGRRPRSRTLGLILVLLSVALAVAAEGPKDPREQLLLGERHETGRGVAKNLDLAAEWYAKAAEQGLAEAQRRLGFLIERGLVRGRDRGEALAWYRKAAEQGDANAQNQVGRLLLEPRGGTPDAVTAVSWFRKSAQAGYPGGEYNLGRCLRYGFGTMKDVGEAKRWLLKAAADDYAQAFLLLGDLFEQEAEVRDLVEAERWYRKAAERGDVQAQAALGSLHLGGSGFPVNMEEARTWLERAAARGNGTAKRRLADLARLEHEATLPAELEVVRGKEVAEIRRAAEKGDPRAQYALAWAHRRGRGASRDPALARAWFEKAARQEFPPAEHMLGVYWAAGHGGPQDFVEGAKWYSVAAAHGYGPAMHDLSLAHRRGQGVPVDESTANDLLRDAAEAGVVASQLFLARLLIDGGRGITAEPSEGKKWLERCAEAGEAECAHWLGFFHQTSAFGEPDPGEAIRWLEIASRSGWTTSTLLLASLHERGGSGTRPTIARDPEKALALYRRAADSGHPGAQWHLGRLHEEGRIVARDDAEAVKWYRLAAAQGDANAQSALGRMLEAGRGVSKDVDEARASYTNAARAGDDGSRNALARLGGEATSSSPLRLGRPASSVSLDDVDGRLLAELSRVVTALNAYWAVNDTSFIGASPQALAKHGYVHATDVRIGLATAGKTRCRVTVRTPDGSRGWQLDAGDPVPRPFD